MDLELLYSQERCGMPNLIRYMCRHEFWPVLEALLASSGYRIDIPIQRSGSGASAMILKKDAVSLLFYLLANQ